MSPNGTSAPAQQHQWTDALGKPVECIHRFSCQVVGLSHTNKYGRDRMGFVNHLTRGTKLVLVPEPDNPYDRNAILVYVEGDLENDLGYLHSSSAKKFCRMMECGATFSAEVYYIYRKPRTNYPEVCIYLYQLTPMTTNRRPIRKGAPEYRVSRTRLPEESSTVASRSVGVPAFQAVQAEQGGFWTKIKRFFLE
jgi:hypothetical protein